MDLEVDQRWRDGREKIIDPPSSEKILAPDEMPWTPSLSISQTKQTWSSRYSLFIGLAMGIALVAIVAGVAGSIAMQRQSRLNSYDSS